MLKCIYSKLFLISLAIVLIDLPSEAEASSRHLILITHWQQNSRAMLMKKRLTQDIGIPASAIDVMEKFNPCHKLFDALYFLCVVEGEELFQIVTSRPLFFREAFGHLLAIHSRETMEAP